MHAVKMGRLVASTAVAALCWMIPRVADACSCFSDDNRAYVDGGMIPLDAPGIPWLLTEGWDKTGKPRSPAARIEVFEVTDAGERVVKFALQSSTVRSDLRWIVPDGGLADGQRYRVRVAESEGRGHQRQRYVDRGQPLPDWVPPDPWIEANVAVGPRAPTAASKIGLSAKPPGAEDIGVRTGASCASVIAATVVDVEWTLPGVLLPYASYLHYQTLVDGKPWRASPHNCRSIPPGRNWTDTIGSDRVYAGCKEHTEMTNGWPGDAADWGLQRGVHRVEVVASLPDTTVQFRSAPISVTLDCASAPSRAEPGAPGSGASVTDSDSEQPEPEPDPTADAIDPDDEAPDARTSASPPEPPPSPGRTRGCSIGTASGGFGWMWLVLARRRREGRASG